MKRDILVFGEDWGRHPTSTQHLFKHLSKNRRVFWVNSIGLRRPKFTARDFIRMIGKITAMFKSIWSPEAKKSLKPKQLSSCDNISSPFIVIEPRVFPWPGNPIARFVNRFLLSRQIKRKLSDFNVQEPIFWTSLPTGVDYIGCFNECGVIYYCGDDFSALAGVDHKPVQIKENELSNKAEVILTASESLRDKFNGKNSIYLPHGVDFDIFANPVGPADECQRDRPICGFYGSIADWVDVKLLANTAFLMPDWDFMLIGPVQTDVSALSELKNVIVLPPQPHELLPSYIQHWQAAVLPFKNNDQIAACNPLKLREYMASGTPIISTKFPAMEAYSDHINIIDDVKSFCEVLRSELSPNDPKRVESESWSERAKDVEQLFQSWE